MITNSVLYDIFWQLLTYKVNKKTLNYYRMLLGMTAEDYW